MKLNRSHAVFLTVLSLLAAGAGYAASPAAGASPLFPTLLTPLVDIALTASLSFLTVLLSKGAKYVSEKTKVVKNEKVQKAIDAVCQLVFSKVAELSQDAVLNLKAASADGKLTKDEAQAALSTAVHEIWLGLPAAFKTVLLSAFGTEEAVKASVIVPQVKEAVQKQKPAQRATLPVPPIPVTLPDQPAFPYPTRLPLPDKPTAQDVLDARRRLGLPTELRR